MATLLQITFSNAFSLMEMYKFWIQISLKFVPKGPVNSIPALVQIYYYLNQWWLVYWCIYASLNLKELNRFDLLKIITSQGQVLECLL